MHLPGHITGIVGEMGSGKSFISLLIAFKVAENYQYTIQTNFALDAHGLYDYFRASGYTWLLHCLLNNEIYVKPVSKGNKILLEKWMSRRRCLYILDEAGIFLNARRFATTSPQFLADLAQIRHDGRKLFWIAQYSDQVDKQLRSLTQSYIYCDCVTKYSKKLGSTELLLKSYACYLAKNFKIFEEKVIDKKKGFKAWLQKNSLAYKSWYGTLSSTDKLLFDCYPSLERIEFAPYLVNSFSSPKYLKVCNDELDVIEKDSDDNDFFNNSFKMRA